MTIETEPEDGPPLDELMSRAFIPVDRTAPLPEVLDRLGGADFAVVTDQGRPAGVLAALQLREHAAAGIASIADVELSAMVELPSGTGATAFAASDAVTLLDLDPIALIILGADGPVGVVPAARIDAALVELARYAQGERLGYDPDTQLPGDASLSGATRSPVARVTCAGCGFTNTMTFFDRRNPAPCQNPRRRAHPFLLRSAG